MNIYTTVIIYEWSSHGDDIKKIFNNNLTWNSSKVSELNNEELTELLKKFKVNNEFAITNSNIGKSGMWEDKNVAIKIVRVEDVDNVILIHKGNEENLYKEFLKKCGEIGALIIKIINNEIVFKYRRNVELLNKLNDTEGEKELRIKNFKIKAEFLGFSENFKNKWIELMKNETTNS